MKMIPINGFFTENIFTKLSNAEFLETVRLSALMIIDGILPIPSQESKHAKTKDTQMKTVTLPDYFINLMMERYDVKVGSAFIREMVESYFAAGFKPLPKKSKTTRKVIQIDNRFVDNSLLKKYTTLDDDCHKVLNLYAANCIQPVFTKNEHIDNHTKINIAINTDLLPDYYPTIFDDLFRAYFLKLGEAL